VISGEATETIFEMTEEGHVFPARTRKLTEGFICATEDLDIHQLSNLQPNQADLITACLFAAAAGDGAVFVDGLNGA